MKVIIIRDTDGHFSAMQYTQENLNKVAEWFIESDGIDLADPKGFTSDDLLEALNSECVLDRRGGSRCSIVEVQDGFGHFRHNPFT